MRQIWVALIVFYQRWLSPYKGFHCAHAAVHKQLTCSEAVKRIIQDNGLWGGRQQIRRRFRECRFAAYLLRSRPQWAMEGTTIAASPPWESSTSHVHAIVLKRAPSNSSDSDKPPIRPEFANGGGISKSGNLEDDASQSPDESKPNPSSYFKTRKRSSDCCDAVCFVPCDAGACDAGPCDAGPCDGCDLGCL